MSIETLEGNKLIANSPFASDTTKRMVDKANKNKVNDSWYSFMEYHTSWDWLMPVVEKIETCFEGGVIVIIKDNRCYLELDTQISLLLGSDFNLPESYSGFCDTKIQAVYSTAIQFIQWYNTQKQ